MKVIKPLKSFESQLILDRLTQLGPQRLDLFIHDISNAIPPGIAIRHHERRRRNARAPEDNRPIDEQVRAGARDLTLTRITDFCRTGRLIRWQQDDGHEWIGQPQHAPDNSAKLIAEAIAHLEQLLTQAGHLDTCFWRPRPVLWPECTHNDHRTRLSEE